MAAERNRHLRVLVVEDEPDMRVLFATALRDLGTVQTCPDVYQALAQLAHEDFDVLVVDHMMPGAHGLELLERLRDLGRPVPAIIVSAMVSPALETQALELGARAVLSKPVDLDLLAKTVVLAASDDDRG